MDPTQSNEGIEKDPEHNHRVGTCRGADSRGATDPRKKRRRENGNPNIAT